MEESISARVAWKLKKAITGKPAKATQNTGTASFVRTDDDGVSWVRLPGANVDTPVNGNLVADMQSGDTVSYRIDGGRLSVTGNATSPSVGGTYVSNTVAPVAEKADKAISDALRAHDAADLAETSAARAQASATSASEYASRALGNLSTVQSVAETLAWITAHGTMTPTTDTAPDPTHVYFVADSSGDYSVGGSTYSVVTEPDASDMATYYELSIDESLNNYVGTHLAVTDEGLWVIPVASGGYKVLIATGSGTTYTTAGTYIIDGSGVTVAFFGETMRIGKTDESHMELDYHSMQLVDKEGTVYFHVSDLRGPDGIAEVVDRFKGDGTGSSFALTSIAIDTSYTVVVSDSSGGTVDKRVNQVIFSEPPTDGATITVTYQSDNAYLKAYTFGMRGYGSIGTLSVSEGYATVASGNSAHSEGVATSALGLSSHAEGNYSESSGSCSHAEGLQNTASGAAAHAEGQGSTASGNTSHAEGYHATSSGQISHAEGGYTTASGYTSHAEGYHVTASGNYSHAEGGYTTASGSYSHAQNSGTIASEYAQTAIGKYNDNQSTSAFEVGNGTADSARSNAFAVDWSGNVVAAGTVTASMQTGTMTLNTTNCTLNTDYNKAWHNGVVATVQLGIFTLNSALSNGGSVSVGTVPDGYRPAGRIYANVGCALAGVTGLLVAYIGTDGTITLVNRSGTSLSTSAGIIVTATYAI